jgi:hypothetical protein
MPITQNPTTVNQAFFQPLTALADASPHTRPCPEFSDEDCLHLGVQRVLETSASERGFLQEHGLRFPNTPGHSNYFAALNSPRRREVIRDVNLALVAAANLTLHDRLADIPELASYECFAQDGHWHKAGAHDLRHDGAKMAVGHFYSLNLRTHTLRHLAAAEGLHEHDMSALKRVKPKGLRQGVPKGNPDGLLKAKMYARARILVRSAEGAVLVPSSSIYPLEGKPFIFVKLADDLFEARAITTGVKFDGQLEVLAGLKPQEIVVVNHGFALKSQWLSSRMGAGCAD